LSQCDGTWALRLIPHLCRQVLSQFPFGNAA